MTDRHSDSLILGQLLQSLPAMVLHIDRHGRCRLAQDSVPAGFARLAPAVDDDRPLADKLAAELRARLPGDVDPGELDAQAVHDIEIATTDGSLACLRTCIFPAIAEDGRRDGSIWLCYDISEQKHNEQLLERKNATLELLLACTNLANHSSEFAAALRGCIDTICSFKNWLYDGWLVGHAYLLDDEDPDLLVSSNIWCCKNRAAIEPFIELTQVTPIRRGQGIPGRVLESGEPIWHGKAPSYSDLPRASMADRCGLISIVAVPVVDDDRVVAVLEFFADDLRPPNDDLLAVLVAIGRELGSVHNREDANRRLRYLADHDQLTGLVVMRVAYDRIDRALAWAARHDNLSAVMFIDLDGFKQINDELGHDFGDELLRRIGSTLAGSVRDVDTVARFGGDEFLVVLTELGSRDDVETIAANLLRNIGQVHEIGDRQVQVSASIGIALCDGNRHTVDEVIHQADDAMYRAKRAGKNRYELFRD